MKSDKRGHNWVYNRNVHKKSGLFRYKCINCNVCGFCYEDGSFLSSKDNDLNCEEIIIKNIVK